MAKALTPQADPPAPPPYAGHFEYCLYPPFRSEPQTDGIRCAHRGRQRQPEGNGAFCLVWTHNGREFIAPTDPPALGGGYLCHGDPEGAFWLPRGWPWHVYPANFTADHVEQFFRCALLLGFDYERRDEPSRGVRTILRSARMLSDRLSGSPQNERPEIPESITVAGARGELLALKDRCMASLATALDPIRSPDLPPADRADHSPDFTSVNWFGQPHEFTPNQRPVVHELWDAWKNNTPVLGGAYLLEAANCGSKKLSDVFRDHPAWGSMIVGSGKDSYRLNPPSTLPAAW